MAKDKMEEEGESLLGWMLLFFAGTVAIWGSVWVLETVPDDPFRVPRGYMVGFMMCYGAAAFFIAMRDVKKVSASWETAERQSARFERDWQRALGDVAARDREVARLKGELDQLQKELRQSRALIAELRGGLASMKRHFASMAIDAAVALYRAKRQKDFHKTVGVVRDHLLLLRLSLLADEAHDAPDGEFNVLRSLSGVTYDELRDMLMDVMLHRNDTYMQMLARFPPEVQNELNKLLAQKIPTA